jgi:hypothetical protein
MAPRLKARNVRTAVRRHWFTKKVASSARTAVLHVADNPDITQSFIYIARVILSVMLGMTHYFNYASN